MKPLIKTAIAAALFLVPLALLCSRPIPNTVELVPLPFKVQASAPPLSLNPEETGEKKVVFIEPLVQGYDPAAAPLNLKSDVRKMKKFSFNYGTLEMQDRDAIRLKGAKVGVDYHVDGQQSVGVEGSQQIYDRQDAKAWDKGGEDESTAGIKYKLIF